MLLTRLGLVQSLGSLPMPHTCVLYAPVSASLHDHALVAVPAATTTSFVLHRRGRPAVDEIGSILVPFLPAVTDLHNEIPVLLNLMIWHRSSAHSRPRSNNSL